VPTESFFNFFSPPQPPTEDDESVASDIEERLELDYQLGEDIKEKLIPRAIDWFTGEALQFEELGDEMDPDEFEDEEEEEEDEEDEDEDDEERGSDRDIEDDSDEEVRHPFNLFFSVSQANYPTRMEPPSPRRRLPSASKTKKGKKV
jgi:nucleosome assembly protein 1-like 1